MATGRTWLEKFLVAIGILMVVFLVPALFLVLSGTTIRLDFLIPKVESLAASTLEREVTIDGPLRLRFLPDPELEIEALAVSNPRDWKGDSPFASIDKLILKADLTSLFSKRISIDRFEAGGAELALAIREDESTNFSFPAAVEQPATSGAGAPGESENDWQFVALDQLELRDIRIGYNAGENDRPYVLTIDEASGRGGEGEPLQLSVTGMLNDHALLLELEGNAMDELLTASSPWRLSDLRLSLGDISAKMSGEISRAPGAGFNTVQGRLGVGIHAESLDIPANLFDLSMPAIENLVARGELVFSPGHFRLANLGIQALETDLSGELGLSLSGTRPALQGQLEFTQISSALVTSLAGINPNTAKPEESEPDTHSTWKNVTIPWPFLQLADVNLRLGAGTIESGIENIAVQNLEVAIELENGDLALPFSLEALGAAMSGRVGINSAGNIPSLEFIFNNEPLALDALLAGGENSEPLRGRLGAVHLEASTKGDKPSQLLEHLEVELELGETRIDSELQPLLLANVANLERDANGRLSVVMHGELLGDPLDLNLAASGERAGSRPGSPVLDLAVNICDAELSLQATRGGDADQAVVNLDYKFQGHKLCGWVEPLEAYLGHAPAMALSGSGTIRPDGVELDMDAVAVDDMKLTAGIRLDLDNPDQPALIGSVHSDYLDLRPLLEGSGSTGGETGPVQAQSDKHSSQLAARMLALLDRDLLPHGMSFGDAITIDISVKELVTGKVDLSDLDVTIGIDDGKLQQAPFHFSAVGHEFDGDTAVDFTGDVPAIDLNIHSRDVDFAHVLGEFDITGLPELTADSIELNLALKGSSIRNLAARSGFRLAIKGGHLFLARPLSDPLRVDISEGVLEGVPGKPAELSLDGLVNAQPLDLLIRGQGLFDKSGTTPPALGVRASLADASLAIDSGVVGEGIDEKMLLKTSLSGQRLDTLNTLLGFDLPPLEAYKFEGSLELGKEKWTIENLKLKTGESALEGGLTLSTTPLANGETGLPLNIDLVLRGNVIQLDDFDFKNWSAVSPDDVEEPPPAGEDGAVEVSAEPSETDLNSLVSPLLAKLLKAQVAVDIDQVRSGADKLGSGQIRAGIGQGAYKLDEFKVNIPGGSLRFEGSLTPGTTTSSARFLANVDKLDYGVLARRTLPDSDLKGEVSLNIDVNSQARTITGLKERINGHVRVGVVPDELLAGVIDLWAVNVVVAALPILTDKSESEVNCLVGDFVFDDGIMHPRVLMLDTSKMRVQGKGEINLKTNEVNFHFNPHPKSAQFLSLATPVSVTGTLTDPNVGVATEDVIGTIFRITTGLVTVPFQKLFGERLAADGQQACAEAMDWVHAPDISVKPPVPEKRKVKKAHVGTRYHGK